MGDGMNEYQDQQIWFELYGFDGVRWEFICDGETRQQMEIIAAAEGPADSYEKTRIKRVFGLT